MTFALLSYVVLGMYGLALIGTVLDVMAEPTFGGEGLLCFKVCIAGVPTSL